jgi:hypothetical protein
MSRTTILGSAIGLAAGLVVILSAISGGAQAKGPPTPSVAVVSPLPLPVTAADPLPVQGNLGVSGEVSVVNVPTVDARQAGTWNVAISNTPSVSVAGAVELVPETSVAVTNTASTPLFVQQAPSTPTDQPPAEILPPGGRTIGGPGLYVPGTSATVPVWRNNAAQLDACATVVNTGSQDLVFTAGGVLPITVAPGVTRSRCDTIITTSFFGLQCTGPGCEAVWRVDLLP